MKLFQLIFLVCVVEAIPLGTDPRPRPRRDVEIQDFVNEREVNGGYHFRYRTSDGTFREETGRIKDEGTDHEVLVVSGRVSWIAPDSQVYSINYVSDEGGYQPMGAHLPNSYSMGKRISQVTKDDRITISLLSSVLERPQTRLGDSTLISLLGG